MSLLTLLKDDDQRENGRVDGVATGIVTNNQDAEGLSRVKVKYPWREDSQESYWARLAVLAAGDNRGTLWIPEVGDEVLLAFDKGDIQHPYVLGSLWNGKDKPPETNSDGQNDTKMIRSRSGHKITLLDKKGGESVEIKTQGGHTILLDDGAGRVEIKDSSGSNKIVIETKQNSLSIESAMSLKIKSQSIDIEAGASMNIKASGTLTIQGALVRIN
ncbi:MAG TPA: phage baseplate assembly protein V [Pyrinomonadaceae bacterium]|nr:phage baseplate assembly protein V [Pyrinomonadaceae bacterium]